MAPYWTTPSSKLLWSWRRPLLAPRFLGLAFFSSSATSLEHFGHRNPPLGPVLLYAVTVKRFPHSSQFPSCPGIGRGFSFIISQASASSSSSASSCMRRALRREKSLLCLIRFKVFVSLRLRFFRSSGVSPACSTSYDAAVACSCSSSAAASCSASRTRLW